MGLFDGTPDPNGDPTLTPGPALDALFAQMPPPAPVAPAPLPQFAPPVSQDPRQKLLQLGSIIAAIIGGPHSGLAGLPTGVLHGQQIAQQEADRQAQFAAQQQAHQQAQQLAQQRIDEQKAQVRGRALNTVAQTIPTFDNPEDYNRFINNAGQTFLLNGFRDLGPNQLRQAYPFVAPNAEKRAKKVLDAWFKNPANAEALKKDPSLAQRAVVQFDANGDGVPENIPLTKLGAIAQMPFAQGSDGQPITMPPDITGDKFHVAVSNEVAKFNATNGRMPNPKEMDAIITEAAKVGKDPELADLQKSSLETRIALEKLQMGMQPTQEDAQNFANDLLAHRLAPDQLTTIRGRGNGALGIMIERAIKKTDPTFNWEQAASEYQLTRSPQFQTTIRIMDSTVESMPRLQQTADKLANGNVRSVNALLNQGKNQFNDVNLKAFKSDVLFVADEIAKILQGGGTGSGTSDAKLKQAEDILNTSDSPRAVAAALNEAQIMIGNRRRALTRGTYLEQPDVQQPQAASGSPEDAVIAARKRNAPRR